MTDPPPLFDESFASAQHRRVGDEAAQAHPLYCLAQRRLDQRLTDIKRPQSVDSGTLVLSCLELQHVNDLAARLTAIQKSLHDGGLFLGVMLGGQSLHELRQCLMDAEINLSGGASPRVAPMLAQGDAASLLVQAGFALPVIDHEEITLTYATLYDLMADLRGAGCANALSARSKNFTRRTLFTKAGELYAQRFSAASGEGITATLDLIFLHGWREAGYTSSPMNQPIRVTSGWY